MQSMQKEFMLYVIDFKFHFLKWMRDCMNLIKNIMEKFRSGEIEN